ncbi:muconolactone Delta-isomerase family protein [Monashia sp. NPDC004114]
MRAGCQVVDASRGGACAGLWAAASAEALQADLESLPMIAWLEVATRPLSVHPSDPARPFGG